MKATSVAVLNGGTVLEGMLSAGADTAAVGSLHGNSQTDSPKLGLCGPDGRRQDVAPLLPVR